MASMTDDQARQYMQIYPNVQQAWQRGTTGGGLSLEDAARHHWSKYGQRQGYQIPGAAAPAAAAPESTLDLSSIPNPVNRSGLPSSVQPQAQNHLNYLTGTAKKRHNKAMTRFAQLPEEIDYWTGETMKGIRTTGDEALDAMNQINVLLAQRGFFGGTPADTLRADAMQQLARNTIDKRTDLSARANELKAQAVAGLPELTSSEVGKIPSMLSSMRESVQEDTTAVPQLIMQMIQSGYTG